MKTVTQHIRSSLEKRMYWQGIGTKPELNELRRTEWSNYFEFLMRNRLIFGAIRYQTFEQKRAGHKYNLLDSVRSRLDAYERDRNLEHLVDCANILMIEFECPTVDGAHFSPIDDGEHVSES